MAAIDRRDLRNAFGAFATGVTVITTSHGGEDAGLTANSFSSVSLDPPLILWSLDRGSRSLGIFEEARNFAVHVLSSDQEDISNRFAKSAPDKFTAIQVDRGEGSVPLLRDCAARFECRKAFTYDGGDHQIFVGEVLRYEHRDHKPLVFHSGRYKRASEAERRDADAPPLATNLSLANLYCRREAIRLCLDAGLAWPDVTALATILSHQPIGAAQLNERLRTIGLMFDESMQKRLLTAGLIGSEGERLSGTEDGWKLAAELTAAVRAVEFEMRLRDEALVERLEHGLDAFAMIDNAADASRTVRSLHELGRSLDAG